MLEFNAGDIVVADHPTNNDKYIKGYPVNGRLYKINMICNVCSFDIKDVETGELLFGYYYNRFQPFNDILNKYNL